MNISRRFFLVIALIGLVTVPLGAAGAKYLAEGTPDPIRLLAPPPEKGSAENAADLESAFRVYSGRTAGERARGVDEW
jgi:hypothetical protein